MLGTHRELLLLFFPVFIIWKIIQTEGIGLLIVYRNAQYFASCQPVIQILDNNRESEIGSYKTLLMQVEFIPASDLIERNESIHGTKVYKS